MLKNKKTLHFLVAFSLAQYLPLHAARGQEFTKSQELVQQFPELAELVEKVKAGDYTEALFLSIAQVYGGDELVNLLNPIVENFAKSENVDQLCSQLADIAPQPYAKDGRKRAPAFTHVGHFINECKKADSYENLLEVGCKTIEHYTPFNMM